MKHTCQELLRIDVDDAKSQSDTRFMFFKVCSFLAASRSDNLVCIRWYRSYLHDVLRDIVISLFKDKFVCVC